MVTIKKVTKEDDFFHVRYRQPGRFEKIRTPDWAARVARSESKGAEVRMGKTSAGNWFVQSVLIKRGGGKNKNDSMRLAGRIRRKIEDGSESKRVMAKSVKHEPNMTASQFRRWMDTEAFADYKADHDAQQVNEVTGRTLRVIKGNGREGEAGKVSGFIGRMKAVEQGEKQYGSPQFRVSARDASLLNWGYDPTGRYS